MRNRSSRLFGGTVCTRHAIRVNHTEIRCEDRFESGARMIRTSLDGADLSRVDLTNARITEEQLREAESLEGATMPDGRKYEDWLKDKEGRMKTDGN